MDAVKIREQGTIKVQINSCNRLIGVHLKLSLYFQGCGRWGHRPRLTALAGVPTSQRQF